MHPVSPLHPLEVLEEYFTYNADTGSLLWAKDIWTGMHKGFCTARAGNIAGTNRPDGYKTVQLFKKRMLVHRVIWALVHQEEPPPYIDHIDGDPSNNRIENLRRVTNAQNAMNCKFNRNNKSGHRGVHWHGPRKKWVASFAGRYLGIFPTVEQAGAAYLAAVNENRELSPYLRADK